MYTWGRPYVFIDATAAETPVTKAETMVLSLTGGVAAPKAVTLSYTGFVVKTAGPVLEHGSRVTKSEGPPIEILGGVSETEIPILEILGGVVSTGVPLFDIPGNVVKSDGVLTEWTKALAIGLGASQIEILKGLSVSDAQILEILGGVSSASTTLVEVPGGAAIEVISSDLIPIEILGSVSKTGTPLLSWISQVSKTDAFLLEWINSLTIGLGTSSIEFVNSISPTKATQIEIIGKPSKADPVLISWRSQVSKSDAALLDWVNGLTVGLDAISIETLGGVSSSDVIIVSWLGVSVAPTVLIHASSKHQNILKSVNKFITERIEGLSAHAVDWGQPSFKEEGLERWAQHRLIMSTGDFVRQVYTDESLRATRDFIGDIRRFFLNFNIFVRFSPRQNTYFFTEIRKDILEYIYFADIPILDFDTEGNPKVGILRAQRIANDSIIDNGKTSGLFQWNITFLATLLYKHSK
jgi:hypothetical protein